MSEQARSALNGPRRISGRDVLVAMIVFFGIIFAVNGYFLHSALSTYTGVISAEPYRKGLHYNQRLAAEARQDALGWQEEISLSRGGRLAIMLKGPDGKGVERMSVTATISRPSTAQYDRQVALQEKEPGLYVAETRALQSGSWIVSLEIRSAATDPEPTFRARRRLWLNP